MSEVSEEKLLEALNEVETGIARFVSRKKKMKILFRLGLIISASSLIIFIIFLSLGLTMAPSYFLIIALVFVVLFIIGAETMLITFMLKKYVYEEREKSYHEILKYINEELAKKSKI